MTRWFEDITIDEAFPLGSHNFTEAEIIRFGMLYDPQYFQIDPEAAKHSHFGGLVASGWHTALVGQRKMIDALFAEEDRLRGLGQEPGIAGPSPGVNTTTFTAPVRPGDTLSYVLTVTSKRPSNSLPGWGLLINALVATNQRGENVYRTELVSFSKRRDYRMPLAARLMLALTRLPVVGKLLLVK